MKIGMELANSGAMHLSPNDPSPASTDAPRTSAARAPVITRDWVCPFCPLLCDDLDVESRGDGSLNAKDTLCSRRDEALGHYGAADAACRCGVDGAEVEADAALAHAAQLLSCARRPLFGGLATEVAGIRALYTLAAGCGAILDHLHGDALSPATLALQDRGAFFTTLSEVRSRADLLVFFGCQPSRRYPRFFTRALADAGFARELIFVGCDVDPAAAEFAQANTQTQTQIRSLLTDADPFDTLALWSALSAGREASALCRDQRDRSDDRSDDSGDNSGAKSGDNTADQGATTSPNNSAANPLPLTVDTLASLQTRIAAARYTVFVYEPAALPGPHAALLIETLNRIVKAANLTSRAACLALGGDDGALSANQTVTWLSGMPLRTRVSTPDRAEGTAPLDHDPYRYRTQRLLAEREVDALLWVASFEPQPWPASLDASVPLIVLGHPALADAAKARGANTVFIPVATPGIDAGGHLFRVDGTVVMPLTAARGFALPSVAQIAAQLSARLANQFSAAPHAGTDLQTDLQTHLPPPHQPNHPNQPHGNSGEARP